MADDEPELKLIPAFDSDEEEAEWWEANANKLDDYFGRQVDPNEVIIPGRRQRQVSRALRHR